MNKRYLEYKDSGVEWIGSIPRHWNFVRIGLIANLGRGRVISNEEISENWGDFPVYSSQTANNGIMGYLKTFDFEGEYVTWTTDGANAGTVYYRSGKFNCTNVCGTLQPKNTDSLNLRYLPYILNISTKFSVRFDINPKLMNGMMARIVIPLPTYSEQTVIANYLDYKTQKIDTLIEKKQRLIELLKEQRTAIINQAVTKGLDPNVPMKDSGVEWIGEIPEHWLLTRLKWIIKDRLKYGANEPAELEDKDLPRYIRITDFAEDGKLRDDTFKSIQIEKVNEYLLEEGDILFARSGATVGKTFQFKNYDGEACFAGYLIKASPNMKIVLSDFLYYFTKSNIYANWKDSIFIQSTIQNISAEKYQLLEICLPPTSEQTTIIKYLDERIQEINTAIQKENQKIDLLKEYRQSLISDVVTGKIDVRDWNG